ncbi:MAG: carboxylesterase family protein, partial [Lachnospiraceae bacterium]|nr:carboxylesterase family protein [Lachnospiraceae bacterium]
YLGDPSVVPFSDYYRTVPLMVNSCISEMGRASFEKDKDSYTEEERRAFFVEKYGEEKGDKIIELFKKAYPGKNILNGIDVDVMTREASFQYAQKKAAESSVPAYNGLLAFVFPIDEGKAAWHCSDLPFIFHNTDKLPLYDLGETGKRIEAQMAGALVNFARTGDPNGEGVPTWTPTTPDTVHTLVFDEVTEERTDMDKALIDYLHEIDAVDNPFAAMGRMPMKDPDEPNERDWLY